jgi:N-acetylmuramoyl-L-alanine amidase
MKQLLIIACAFFTISYTYALSDSTKITLVIDAGHGGKDPGNLASSSEFLNEKELNLKIALKFGEYVEAFLGHKIEIIYTRTDDMFVELNDRILLANKNRAEYFISIHCNSSKNPNAFGTETHINNLESRTSLELAHAIEREFVARAGRHSRGVKLKEDRLYNLMVLQYANMASVLIETGFMTNFEEEKFLNSEYGQDIIASAIYRAFSEYVELKYGIVPRLSSENLKPKHVGTIYKIQLCTSTGPISTETDDFIKLNEPIEETKTESNDVVWYKYYIGNFATQKEAKKALKDVQKIPAFKFAFVVRTE